MTQSKRAPIVMLFVFMTLHCGTSATFDSVKASCSKACQNTVNSCKQLAQNIDPNLATDCQLMKATVNGVTTYQCLVKIGFCTEIEFVKLKNAACGGSDSEEQIVSQAKTALYTALNATSDACKQGALQCIMESSVATVLKQNEQFCGLLQISNTMGTTQSCLTSNGCTDNEFNQLKSTACTSPAVTGGRFANAVIATSQECKSFMETCTGANIQALALIQSEQYCQVMNINNNGQTTYSCLVGSTKCTQSEFDQLKEAACSGTAVYAGWVTLLTCLMYSFF